MTDFLIVGRGLAATVLMHTFKQHSISFKTIGLENLSLSSRVAAGIWNPIVFKRHTKSWLANDLVPYLISFYSYCEKETGEPLIKLRPIIKPFTENQEKALWLNKSKNLSGFTEAKVFQNIPEDLKSLKINNEYGIVNQCGNLNVKLFLDSASKLFTENIINQLFEYDLIMHEQNYISYKSLPFKNIIFCEGFLVKDNPYFNWIPLKPAKGEIISIDSNELELNNYIFNKNGFILRTGKSTFTVGATYAWDDHSQTPTKKAFEELISKLEQMSYAKYTIIKQEAGIRPSSIDRRPIIGPHPQHPNFFVFNGLGTKGVMLAPYFAKNFVHFYLQQGLLNQDVHIKRFYSLYEQKKQK